MSDKLEVLRALLETPSNLGKKRLTALKLEGLQILSSAADETNNPRVDAICEELFQARKRRHGGQLGAKDQFHFANDRIVFEQMIAGQSQAAAIRDVYGDDTSGTHKKRIQRRKEEMESLAEALRDIEPPEN